MSIVEKIISSHDNDEIFWDAVDVLSGDFYISDGDIHNIKELDDLTAKAWTDYRKDIDCLNGVSKIVLVFKDIALKTTVSGEIFWDDEIGGYDEDNPIYIETDYCKIEAEIYQEAVARGIEEFFAEVREVERGVYAQERCRQTLSETIDNFAEKYAGYECEEWIRNRFSSRVPVEALQYWLCTKSIFKIDKLMNFLFEYDINDLHRGNIGWFGDEIKLFDYSGYRSTTSKILEEKKEKNI